jgi:glucosamine-phosphate N-acetyltransferase
MKSRPGTYYVTVIEDVNTGKIIAAATLVVELKFIRQCAMVRILLMC